MWMELHGFQPMNNQLQYDKFTVQQCFSGENVLLFITKKMQDITGKIKLNFIHLPT